MGNHTSRPPPGYEAVSPGEPAVPAVPVEPAATSSPDGPCRSESQPLLETAEPYLRGIAFPNAFLAVIFCPLTLVTTDGKNILAMIAMAPLILSAILALILAVGRRVRRRRGTQPSNAGRVVIATFDLFLCLFHLAMFIGVNCQIKNSRWWSPAGGVILGTWVSFLLLTDFVVHGIYFIAALPKLKRLLKSRKNVGSRECPRCGYDQSLKAPERGVGAVFEDGHENKKTGKSSVSLLGNYTEESDYESGPSGRPSEETVGSISEDMV